MNKQGSLVIGMVLACADLVGCGENVDETCHAPCIGNDVCVRGVCVDAFDQDWVFTAKSIEVAATEPDGTMWDSSNNSPPDPYAIIFVDDYSVLQTHIQSDSYTAHWGDKSAATALRETDAFEVEAIDSDTFGGGDVILDCKIGALTAEMLRTSEFVCTGAGGKLRIGFTPQPR